MPVQRTASEVFKRIKSASAALPTSDPHLTALLALLRAAHHMHWTTHWQVQGPTSYSDHELFERLYSNMVEEIDGLAEKLVSLAGPEAVNPRIQSAGMADFIKAWLEQPMEGRTDQALVIEQDVQDAIRLVLDSFDTTTPVGLRNFLEDLADKHDTHIYLLKQRTTPVNPPVVARVATRYLQNIRHAALDYGYGPESRDLSWQGPLPVTTECVKCGETARLAVTLREYFDHDKTKEEQTFVTRNTPEDNGFWIHDSAAFAIYLCSDWDCATATCLWNQA